MSQNVGSSFPNLNPLGYAGNNKTNPPQLHIMKRAPTTADVIPYAIGDEWLDTSASPYIWYKLCDKKQGVGTWLLITANSQSINEIQADSGSALPVNGVVKSKGAAPISTSASGDTLTTSLETPLKAIYGGTGNASIPTDGQVPIGDGTKYVPATLTAGTGITITNGPGSITIKNSGILQDAIKTINSIYPDALKNFAINAGSGITITPGTNSITISQSVYLNQNILQTIYFSSGTHTFQPTTRTVFFELVGGGGAGGGSGATAPPGNFSRGGGGGGGGYIKRQVNIDPAVDSPWTINIGAGGIGTTSNGGNGGETNIYVPGPLKANGWATGGLGGKTVVGTGNPTQPGPLGEGGEGGKGQNTGPVYNCFSSTGESGDSGLLVFGGWGYGGKGGASQYGVGGSQQIAVSGANGNPPWIGSFAAGTEAGFGGGGGGATSGNPCPNIAFIGGNGKSGVAIITEFGTASGGGSLVSVNADTGSATPTSGVMSFFGGAGIKTSASGSSVSIALNPPVGTFYGGTGTTSIPTNGQILFGSGGSYSPGTLTAGQNILITPSAGTETVSLTGTINPANGGIGTSAIPGNGNIPIGSSATGKYVPATLTAGTGITITNGPGSITISSTGGGTGSYINKVVVQKFITSGFYTPTAGAKYIVVEVLGGGGAGGGTPQTTSLLPQSVGGGGGASEYNQATFPISFITTPLAITIGSAGIGVAGAAGGAGGQTSFGAYLTANGGNGGKVANTVNPGSGGGSVGEGGAGGSGSTVLDVQVNGQQGGAGFLISNIGISGRGGDSFYGTGGFPALYYYASGPTGVAYNGNTGYNFGAGGSGAIANQYSASQAQKKGGNGTAGICIITEYLST